MTITRYHHCHDIKSYFTSQTDFEALKDKLKSNKLFLENEVDKRQAAAIKRPNRLKRVKIGVLTSLMI